jgi:hypothetical protein
MTDNRAVKILINELIREEALVIGSLVTSHAVSDDFLWELCRNLDALRIEFLSRLEPAHGSLGGSRSKSDLRPHPAVQELLRRIAENK